MDTPEPSKPADQPQLTELEKLYVGLSDHEPEKEGWIYRPKTD